MGRRTVNRGVVQAVGPVRCPCVWGGCRVVVRNVWEGWVEGAVEVLETREGA